MSIFSEVQEAEERWQEELGGMIERENQREVGLKDQFLEAINGEVKEEVEE